MDSLYCHFDLWPRQFVIYGLGTNPIDFKKVRSLQLPVTKGRRSLEANCGCLPPWGSTLNHNEYNFHFVLRYPAIAMLQPFHHGRFDDYFSHLSQHYNSSFRRHDQTSCWVRKHGLRSPRWLLWLLDCKLAYPLPH